MKNTRVLRTAGGAFKLAGIIFLFGALVWAQVPAPPPAQPGAPPPPAQPLSPDQLDNLVAPIALYPDPLLGQALAASTYPLELVEVEQWLQQNRNLTGDQLMDAVRQQNWDPSVQALVAFPDVLSVLTGDIRWATDLGNAYLSQQGDVMAAVQRMRLRAQQNGRLASTPQQTVTTEAQNGQTAIVIEPASPQVIYVPVYNPEYIWGPPVWGYYPPLWYPGIGFGFGFGPGIFLGAFFPGWGGWGWGGWGVGWGWGCGWFGGGLYVNNFFFNHYGFRNFYAGGFYRGGFGNGREGWVHDPYHRAGVGYPNRAVAARYNTPRFEAGRVSGAARGFAPAGSAARPYAANGWRSFNGGAGARGLAPQTNRGFAPSTQPGVNRGFAGGDRLGQASRGFSNPSLRSEPRSYAAPRSFGGSGSSPRSFSAPAAPRSGGFGGSSRSFGSGSGRSFGGGGGHSGGGGGHGGRR